MAQGLGEYGGIVGGGGGSGSVGSGLQDLVSTIENALRNPTPKTWVGIAIFFFVLWFLFIRRR